MYPSTCVGFRSPDQGAKEALVLLRGGAPCRPKEVTVSLPNIKMWNTSWMYRAAALRPNDFAFLESASLAIGARVAWESSMHARPVR